jgi:3-hydroxybutyryl-CoA dehydratase
LKLAEPSFWHRPLDAFAVGETYTSLGRTITEADIVIWCGHTGDHHPMHTDAEYAKSSRFGQRLAPGYMVLAFSIGSAIARDATHLIANYGADRLRFLRPVFIGDTIKACVRVEEVHPKAADSGVVTFAWEISNQREEMVVSAGLKFAFRREA